jgi:ribosomal subunit interface protein
MNITIKTKDLELTPALQEWINEKIGGLEKYVVNHQVDGQLLCEVEVARSSKHHNKGDVFYAEVNLHMPGRILRAEANDADARVAIDRVRDTIQHDLIKYKDKEGLTGKAMRHMSRMSKVAMQKALWWRNK